jgi:hypothetical protein
MTADVPTLLLIIIVSSVVVSGVLLVLNGGQRRDGLQYWAAALLLSAAAHGFLLLYGRIPLVASVVLGNALLSATLVGFWLAVRRFHGLSLRWWWGLVPIGTVAVLMFIFQHQFVIRVVVSGLSLAAQVAIVLWVLLRYQPWCAEGRSRGALLLVIGLTLILLTMLSRAGAALFFRSISPLFCKAIWCKR